ncbi:MAG: hypothetical protein ACD_49C00060G0049 [uncultured bacterium (gcode 4)]|uniref:ABC transporter domain-containing protein n=1 Tax=uncultured bacterium (gcode 4) TaxID=1234023 RepID=K2AWQ5_9BACT|nr:MAG: hypothetical protein ACD_49C00060G0049 [uncultured bacterium (gcode 4)]
MLQINNLGVEVENKKILENLTLDFEIGKTYFLLGKNGSGKSSLAFTLAGHPKYKIISWEIILDWKSLNNLTPDERNKLGIFLSFQNTPEIPGVNLWEYLRIIYNNFMAYNNSDSKPISQFLFTRLIEKNLSELNISKNFLERDLNVGFSGWEKRKIELLQIKILNPKYIILDEIDSGLDIDAFKIVAGELGKLKNEQNSLIFITHNFGLLEFINVDWVFVLENWKLVDKWWIKLAHKIQKEWYCWYCRIEETCNLKDKCV